MISLSVVAALGSACSLAPSYDPEQDLTRLLRGAAPTVEDVIVQRGEQIVSPWERAAVEMPGYELETAISVDVSDESSNVTALHVPNGDARRMADAYVVRLGPEWRVTSESLAGRGVLRFAGGGIGDGLLYARGNTLFIVTSDEWGLAVLDGLP